VREVEFDSTGNVIVVGGINGEFDFDGQQVTSSGADELLLKLSPSGVALWAKVYGDDSTQEGWAVAVDPWDAIAAAVSGLGNIDFGGGLLEGQGNLDIFFHKLN
jgi:hypothetical protein